MPNRLVLLDTSILYLTYFEPERISKLAQAVIDDDDVEFFLSAVSTNEVAIKIVTGKVIIPVPLLDWIERIAAEFDAQELMLTNRHSAEVATLPPHHRDPFDRLLIAQARVEGLAILSSDVLFDRYDVERIW